MDRNICIIGCGWLGFPLAQSLIHKGYHIKGSTTSKSKLERLRHEGVDPYHIVFSTHEISGDIEKCLKGCETLILNIPPGFKRQPDLDFKRQMAHIIPLLETSSISNVLLVSSTSVYEDSSHIPIIYESTPTSKTSHKANQLVAVEHLFFDHPQFNTTILRFAGLYGNERHPAIFLSGKEHIKNPDAPVNLIHLQDCIGIIETIIETSAWNIILNASNPYHPSRIEYYTKVCRSMGIPLPQFDHTQNCVGKLIDSSRLVQKLNYQFQVNL